MHLNTKSYSFLQFSSAIVMTSREDVWRHRVHSIRVIHTQAVNKYTEHEVQMKRLSKQTEKNENKCSDFGNARVERKMELFESFKVIDTKAFCVLFAYVIYRTVCELVPSSSFFVFLFNLNFVVLLSLSASRCTRYIYIYIYLSACAK